MRSRLPLRRQLRALPSWRSCQRDKRMPRPVAPALVLCRSCSLESRGVLPLHCTAIKRDAIGCALRWSFQPQPTPSVRQHSPGAIASQNGARQEARNAEPASRRSDCEPAPSTPHALLLPTARLSSPYSTTGLENSRKVLCLLRREAASLARPAAWRALSCKAPRTRACPVCRCTKLRSRKKGMECLRSAAREACR